MDEELSKILIEYGRRYEKLLYVNLSQIFHQFELIIPKMLEIFSYEVIPPQVKIDFIKTGVDLQPFILKWDIQFLT